MQVTASIPSVTVCSFRSFIKIEGCKFTEESGEFTVTAKTPRQQTQVLRYLQTRKIKYELGGRDDNSNDQR